MPTNRTPRPAPRFNPPTIHPAADLEPFAVTELRLADRRAAASRTDDQIEADVIRDLIRSVPAVDRPKVAEGYLLEEQITHVSRSIELVCAGLRQGIAAP